MAAAAPEIPAVGVGAFTIGVAVIFAFAWALDVFYRNVISPVVKRIAAIGFGGVRGHLGAHPFGFLTHVDDTVLRWLHNAKASTEAIMVRSFHVFVNFQVAVAHNVAQTTVDAYNALHRLQFYWTPYFIGVKLRPIQHAIDGAKVKGSHTAAKSHPNTKTVVKNITYKVTKVQKITQHQTTIAHGQAQIKPLEWKNVKANIAKVKWLIALGGLVGFGNALFKKFNLSWLRCPGIQRVGTKFGCGIGRFLEAVLFLAIDAVAITHLCTITKLLTDLGVAVQPLVVKLTTGVGKLMECQGVPALPDLTLQAFDLPAVEGDGLAL